MQLLTFGEVARAAHDVADRAKPFAYESVYGVPRGGVFPAAVVAERLAVPLAERPGSRSLVVDDLVDSGRTAQRFDGLAFDACFRKATSPRDVAPHAWQVDGWVVFPWELDADGNDHSADDAVVRLIEHIGEDPNREGLRATPGRVLKAYAEMTEGYAQDPAAILATTFSERCDEMVLLSGISFVSVCEHHLLPFTGTATVGYLPTNRVVGLSKLARIVECFARRLQVQERMTTQIAEALEEHVHPLGVGVVVTAFHSCMGCRGVRKPTAAMTTSAMLGALRDNPAARAEFLSLAHP